LKTKAHRWLQNFFTLGPEDTQNPKIAKFFRRNFFVNTGDLVFWHFGDSFVSIDTILPVFVSTITTSPVLIGLVRALWQAGWFLPQLFLAPTVEKRKRQLPLVLVLATLERLPYLIIGFAILWFPKLTPDTAVALFMILYGWKSFIAGTVALPWQEMIARVIPVTRRGRFIGVSHLIGRIFGVLAGVLAGIVLTRITYPNNYATLFFIAFIVISISWLFLSRTKEPIADIQSVTEEGQPPYFERLKRILREHKNFRNFLISRSLAYMGNMAYGFVAVYVIQRFNLPDSYAALFTTILFASGTIGYIFWGGIGDRIGHKWVIISSNVIWITGLVLLVFSSSLFWVYIVFALMSIATRGSMLGDFSIAMEFGSESDRPTYIGLAKTMTGPVVLFAPLIAGMIVNWWGYMTMFIVSLIFSILAVTMLGVNVKEPRSLALEKPRLR
jgi:MFS family permease